MNGQQLLVTLKGVEKDIEGIKEIMAAVTAVLRDNLITLVGHDKASQDLRQYLISVAAILQEKVTDMEASIRHVSNYKMALDSSQAEIVTLLDSIQSEKLIEVLHRMEKSLNEFYGLVGTATPSPLARDLQEALRALRDLTDKDPDTGKPLPGFILWWRRGAHVAQLAVAGAFLAALYAIVSPYFSFGHK